MLKHLAGEHYQSEYFYNLNGTNCVKHLFRVASSLDSLIVGEGQILSQIKNAYQIARNNGMTDTILNTIMNKAIAVGKRVRTETKIAYSSVSVSSAAVDLAIKILGDLSKAQILVVGAGHMSELTAQHLLDKGAQTICVSNRHYERAQDLADKFHGTAIPYRAMFEHAADADVDDNEAKTLHNAAGDALRNAFFKEQADCTANQDGHGVDDGSKHGIGYPFRVMKKA